MDKIFKKWNKYVHSYNENSIKRQNLISATHVVIDLIKEAKKEVFDDIEDWLSEGGAGDWRAWDSGYLDRYDKLKKKHLQPPHKRSR